MFHFRLHILWLSQKFTNLTIITNIIITIPFLINDYLTNYKTYNTNYQLYSFSMFVLNGIFTHIHTKEQNNDEQLIELIN